MKTTAMILAAFLTLAGCSYLDRHDPAAKSEPSSKVREIDQACINDCLGGNTDSKLCESRCQY